MKKEYPTSRSISQLLSHGGFRSAGVRQRRNCSYLVPPKARGYGCTEMICYPPNGVGDTWRGVEISWYGTDEPPFSNITLLLWARGFDVTAVDPKSLNTGHPSITVWFAGAHEAAVAV